MIAAVSGYALGGGCELALACDYRIAGERAVFGQPEILLGIIPGGGGTQRLARVVGASRAKELCLTGRQVKAEEALRIGLADEVVPGDELEARALALAAEVARGALVAQALAKRAIDEGLGLPLERGPGGRAGAVRRRRSTPRTAGSAWRASSSTARARPPSPAAEVDPGERTGPRAVTPGGLGSRLCNTGDGTGGCATCRGDGSARPRWGCGGGNRLG